MDVKKASQRLKTSGWITDLEHHDEVVAPVVQQEEPSIPASTDVPTKSLAHQNLPAVEIMEEREAPIQELVEHVEEGSRNDEIPPSIDQEPEIPQSELVNVEHGNFGEKEREPKVEYHDEVVAPASTDVSTEGLAPQKLPAVEIIEEKEAPIQLLVEFIEEGPKNDDPPPNIDEEIRRPRLMEFDIKNKGKPWKLAEQFILDKKRPESERSYLIEQFRNNSKKFNRTRSRTRNQVQMDPVVLEDLSKSVEDVQEDRRNQFNNVTKMANFILNELLLLMLQPKMWLPKVCLDGSGRGKD